MLNIMNIRELMEIDNFDNEDIMIIDTIEGTKKIKLKNLLTKQHSNCDLEELKSSLTKTFNELGDIIKSMHTDITSLKSENEELKSQIKELSSKEVIYNNPNKEVTQLKGIVDKMLPLVIDSTINTNLSKIKIK